ncbi:hypothetical protein [Methanosarcina sp. DH1]|uniref:hypothetical protein n=1 Tax=Methanosarcina sp. DH1 TaxID=2605695 RepID=UPI001E2FF9F4|nr:hypothetical protein [Methanosarcina sp. DH1]
MKNPQKREKSTKKRKIHKKEKNPQKRTKSTKKNEIHKKRKEGKYGILLKLYR